MLEKKDEIRAGRFDKTDIPCRYATEKPLVPGYDFFKNISLDQISTAKIGMRAV